MRRRPRCCWLLLEIEFVAAGAAAAVVAASAASAAQALRAWRHEPQRWRAHAARPIDQGELTMGQRRLLASKGGRASSSCSFQAGLSMLSGRKLLPARQV